MINLSSIKNPIWSSSDNLRDPSVVKTDDGYYIFFSRYSNNEWNVKENWAIASVFTKDFIKFEENKDITSKGFASPGDVVFWGGRYIIPFQSYPSLKNLLYFSESENLNDWSEPKLFLEQAVNLPWNGLKRLIDPSFVVNGDTLHCFFVGSTQDSSVGDFRHVGHANLLGHAITKDKDLKNWEIISENSPLLGCSNEAPDGVENVMVFRQNDEWIMIYSEGLKDQHLAYATSKDLFTWNRGGEISTEKQSWNNVKYGAPFIWQDGGKWIMMLMGMAESTKTTFGIFTSQDGLKWEALDEKI